MPKAKKFTETPTTEEFVIPKTDQDRIVIPNNLGECPDNKLLILQDDALQQTPGGIIIPDTAVEIPNTGIVIRVGDRLDGKPSKQDIGDRVFFGKYSGQELSLMGTTYLLLGHLDVLWTIKK